MLTFPYLYTPQDFEADMNKMAFENTVKFVENPSDGDTPSYVQQYLRSSTNQRVHLSKFFCVDQRLYWPNFV